VDNSHQLNSRWYSGSGIYRPVWLIVADPVHVAHWGVSVTTTQVSAESATVRIKTLERMNWMQKKPSACALASSPRTDQQ